MPLNHYAPGWVASGLGTTAEVRCARVEFGALPNATTKNVAHGIPLAQFGEIVDIIIVASSGLTQRKFPDREATVEADLTNLRVITAVNLSAFSGTGFIYYVR